MERKDDFDTGSINKRLKTAVNEVGRIQRGSYCTIESGQGRGEEEVLAGKRGSF